MSSTIVSFTSNWFRVSDLDSLRDHISNIYCNPCSYGAAVELEESGNRVRLTMYDNHVAELAYEDEDGDFIELAGVIQDMLVEGEVFRLTTLSWFKGRLEYHNEDVYTWDGRSFSSGTNEIRKKAAEELGIESARLDGWCNPR